LEARPADEVFLRLVPEAKKLDGKGTVATDASVSTVRSFAARHSSARRSRAAKKIDLAWSSSAIMESLPAHRRYQSVRRSLANFLTTDEKIPRRLRALANNSSASVEASSPLGQRLKHLAVEKAEHWYEGYLPNEELREYAEVYFENHEYDEDEDRFGEDEEDEEE
jgi:hypothetical protein